ncbi:MAG: hypothetical protein HKO71_07925 [Pseudomonadales bacterium]|nr:hypothetical protein [Pseudomonadales bacterium]
MAKRVVGPGFQQKVYRAVQQVPAGQVSTYGDIASVLGSAQVARHVGWALAALPAASSGQAFNSETVPWHRVINARGTVSAKDNALRGSEQYRRLCAEGVAVSANGKIDLQQYRCKLATLVANYSAAQD